MSRESHWFNRTFNAGTRKPKRKVSPEENAALRARADTLAECAALAWTFEQEQANLAFVRTILEHRAKDAAAEADRLIVDASLGGAGTQPGMSGDMASPHPAPPNEGHLRMVAKAYDAAFDAVDHGRHSVHHRHWLRAVEDEAGEAT